MKRALIFGFLLLLIPLSARATITRIQGCSALSLANANNANCTMASPVVAGDILIIGSTSYDTTVTFTSFTATGDTCATNVAAVTEGADLTIVVGSCPNTAANTPTVTATWSAVQAIAGFYELIAEEYSGATTATPFDVSGSNTGLAATTCTATSATTTQSNELVFGYCGLVTAGVTTAGSGCTKRQETSDNGSSDDDKNVTATGAQTCSFTMASSNFAMIVATYIDATQAGGAPAGVNKRQKIDQLDPI